MRMTFLIGPTVATHFYNSSDDWMSQKEVYGYSVPTFGNDVVFAVDEKVPSAVRLPRIGARALLARAQEGRLRIRRRRLASRNAPQRSASVCVSRAV